MAIQVPGIQPDLVDTHALQPVMEESGYTGAADNQNAANMQRLGQGISSLSSEAARIYADQQDQVNQTQADNAIARLKQRALDLTFGTPDGSVQGYQGLKGQDAFMNTDGTQRDLSGDYANQLDQASQDISANLGNDRQRYLYQQRATDIGSSFRGQVAQHQFGEFKNYSLSTQDGLFKGAVNDAVRSIEDGISTGQDNSLQADTAIMQAAQAVAKSGRIQGKSPEEIGTDITAATSTIHSKIISSFLDSGNSVAAQKWLQNHKDPVDMGDGLKIGGMTASDLVSANDTMMRFLDQQVSQKAVAATTQATSETFQPSMYQRLINLVGAQESGNKDYNADGTAVTSGKGAKYGMQVMPDTAANPGFGIAPAADDSPQEYNRVGKQLLAALINKYGNTYQALAAYNAGTGRVDDAIAQAQKDGQPQGWGAYLPKETQNYMSSIMGAFQSGQGAPMRPTEQQFIASAVSALGPSANPNQVKLTQEGAQRQYGIITKSIDEQNDQLRQKAQQMLLQNGGDLTQLPQDLMAALSAGNPRDTESLIKFARDGIKGINVSDPQTYMTFKENPMALAQLSPSQFMDLRTKLSMSDWKDFDDVRTQIQQGTYQPVILRNSAVKEAINQNLTNIGINPSPGPHDMKGLNQVMNIRKYVEDNIVNQESSTGKNMSVDDIRRSVDSMFLQDTTFKKSYLFGLYQPDSSKRLLNMGYNDIPAADVQQIRGAMQKGDPSRGIRPVLNPTNDEVLRRYWALKGSSNGN